MKFFLSILILTFLGTCSTQERPGFIPMAPEDYIGNTLIATLQDVGTQYLLNLAYQAGQIADTNFTYNHTNYILNRTSETIIYFDFNVSLVNAQNDSIETAFIIWYFPDNDTSRVDAHTYSVEYGGADSAAGPNSTYIPLPEEEYNEPLIQTLANFGKDFIVDILISREAIAPGDYNITEINSILRQILTVGARYQFDLYFAQEDGSNLRHGEYRILYLNATGGMEVAGYRFSNVTGAEGTPQTTNTTPINPETDETATDTTPTNPETDETATDTTPTEEAADINAGEEGAPVEPVSDDGVTLL